MGKSSTKIIRTSIFSFLQNFHYFTSAPPLLAFPYAASALLSQSIITSSPLLPLARARLMALFLAAGFPPSSRLFAFLNLSLSQSVLTSLLVSPFSLSFLLLSKGSVISALSCCKFKQAEQSSASYWISIFNALFITQLCSTLVILAANAVCFFTASLLFNFFDIVGFYSPGPLLFLSAVVYSIILANAYIVCSLALVQSGMERRGGFISILKACVMIQGRIVTALTLAMSVNTALIAVEALFQYRVVRSYRRIGSPTTTIFLEGMFISYLYALLLVLETVFGCVFWSSCKKDHRINQENMYQHHIEIGETNGKSCAETEALDLLP
ncbi:uncharacterized protein LOC127240791 [Andrographis paniculata]|uniref:uncharacterized protein LOC127240791 n=1 Tax=Andrographis paniculata TaxID=175694 RepID=UPI0021E90ADA|nr:uncharacterized protein LOC127240791 [Andrographis paniculata]